MIIRTNAVPMSMNLYRHDSTHGTNNECRSWLSYGCDRAFLSFPLQMSVLSSGMERARSINLLYSPPNSKTYLFFN